MELVGEYPDRLRILFDRDEKEGGIVLQLSASSLARWGNHLHKELINSTRR